MSENSREPLTIKIRGEDGYRVTTIRVKEGLIQHLDRLADEVHCSRNELINRMLEYGIKNTIIEHLPNQEIEERKKHPGVL